MGWALFILALVALGGLIIAPFWAERRRAPMDQQARRAAPGALAQLPRGLTHYQWLGAARGPVAVCVHGLTTPSFIWGPVAAGLGALGFRVLVYDLYGRGFSDRPEGPQDSAFFVAQLADLLEDQGIEGDITLLGYSMGGAIAAAYAATYPEQLRQLVLIAPAGMGHDLGPMGRLVTQNGFFGKWLMYALYGRSFRQGIEAERASPGEIADFADRQLEELRYRGFLPAIHGSLKEMLEEPLDEAHAEIGRMDIPVLAIWGKEDDIIPITGLGKLAEWNRVARHEVIDGAGHGLVHTHTGEVMHAMRALMRD